MLIVERLVKDPRRAHPSPVLVIRLHRSGSSIAAGILHRLHAHTGNRLIGYENRGGSQRVVMAIYDEFSGVPGPTQSRVL